MRYLELSASLYASEKLDSEGNIINEINTKLTRMKVLEGCEAVESEIEERYMTDLAGQLYKELDKVKKRGSDVKKRLAAVITGKGVETASGDDWEVVIDNAQKISTGTSNTPILSTTMISGVVQCRVTHKIDNTLD